jgi:DNA polymerase delta subunit 1
MSITFQSLKWEVIDKNMDIETYRQKNRNPYDNDTQKFQDNIVIYCYGLTQDAKKVCIKINDFIPYVYIELDPKCKWNPNSLLQLDTYLKSKLNNKDDSNNIIKCILEERLKTYYSKKALFYKVYLKNTYIIYKLINILKTPVSINGIKYTLKVHEQKVPPLLQLFANCNIKPSGWLQVPIIENNDKFSNSDIETVISVKDLKQIESKLVVNPTIMSYDLECISEDSTGNTFPNASNKDDQIICICATIGKYHDTIDKWTTVALVNEVDGKKCKNEIENCNKVIHFKNEKELLLGWANFIKTINPDIITGYNTLSFDDKYIIDRCRILKCWSSFSKILGRLIGIECGTEERKWSSSAYGEQYYYYLTIPGIVHLDMMPTIFKDFTTLASYKLDYVAEYFIGENKIDLPAKEMIQMWHKGGIENISKIVKYCNQDTILPFKLMQKLNTLIGLTEMANVVMIQMFDIITRGQQIRVFAQQYMVTQELGYVCVEKDSDYSPTESEKEFVGATVQTPLTGFWKLVATFDFVSLYPTTIIAYNLCFSTFIPESDPNPDPDTYNTFEWEDHSGCEHDKTVRKSAVKIKKICTKHSYRFYKSTYKKGIIPIILERLLAARANTRAEIKQIQKNIDNNVYSPEELIDIKRYLIVLDKRQLNYKLSGNSTYGGLGSQFSFIPFYPAAACTTAMGRKNIQKVIDYAYKFRDDTKLIYGDTDSCMIHFTGITNIKECFQIAKKLEEGVNSLFIKPMKIELEKIYSIYFLLSKKRYIGYISDENNILQSIDKKGVVIKRRDNCEYLRDIYNKIVEFVMASAPIGKIYKYLGQKIDDLLEGKVPVQKLTITKSIKGNYKSANLPHVAVSKKMIERGQYVAVGTRISYVFIKTDNKKDPQYVKAEDPDYYIKNKNKVELDYMYYFEKQLINPIDEIFEVRYKKLDVLKNLFTLLNKGNIQNAKEYFTPKFEIN